MRTHIIITFILSVILSMPITGAAFFNNQQNKTDEHSLSVFPNPVKDKGHIQFILDKKSDLTIEFFDMTGKRVKEIKVQSLDKGEHQLEFEPGEMNNGVYLCRVTSNHWVKAMRVIVKKN